MTVSDPAWTPPLDAAELATVLDSIRRWRPFDGAALLDDIGEVLDNVVPAKENVRDLAEALGEHLVQLVNIAVAAEAHREDPTAGFLIQRARAVGAESLPGDHRQAVGHLRRLAWSVNELLERLAAIQCLKEAA
ncbi:DUF6415 family natural product biosynthesis protein [Streptomyces sp. NPDC004629]|uniref:DUF6415 family natural product biosynthesis protein n=1 Tax=Streptomyces sp. NPDC004629 TaxID=3364705 RepID=UPI0036D10752